MIRNMNSVLKELLIAIIALGVLIQIIGVFFVSDQVGFAIGLWIGILGSCLSAIHMQWAIETGLDLGEGAKAHVTKHSVIRYGVILIIFFALAFFVKYAVVPCFLGLMTLKVAAYLQPFTHKFILKVQGNRDSH